MEEGPSSSIFPPPVQRTQARRGTVFRETRKTACETQALHGYRVLRSRLRWSARILRADFGVLAGIRSMRWIGPLHSLARAIRMHGFVNADVE